MSKRKKKRKSTMFGFTLTELLEVIIILTIILVLILFVLGIEKLVDIGKSEDFKNEAKTILQQLAHENVKDEGFDITQVTLESIISYGLTNENYSDLKVGIINNKPYIVVIGKNKWNNLKVCGTMQDMKVVLKNNTKTCKILN